jgi:hypothetical protein
MHTDNPLSCVRRSTRWVFFCACLSLLAPQAALAEPFAVTSGFMSLYSGKFDDGTMYLKGPRLSAGVVGSWFPGGPRLGLVRDAQTVDLSTVVAPGGFGWAQVDGISYADVDFRGTLRFAARPVVFRDVGGEFASLSTPFTMNGELLGYYRQQSGRLAFSIPLIGGGTMSAGPFRRFIDDAGRAYYSPFGVDASRVMSFEPVAAVPEPATFALVGIGIAGAITARRRQKELFQKVDAHWRR